MFSLIKTIRIGKYEVNELKLWLQVKQEDHIKNRVWKAVAGRLGILGGGYHELKTWSGMRK